MGIRDTMPARHVDAFDKAKCSQNNQISRREEVTSLINDLPEMLDQVERSGKPFYYDEVLKDFLHDARFTGFLLSRVVKEIKGVSIDKFCEYTGACEEEAFKLKIGPTQFGTMDTKAIRLDFVLEFDGALENLLRINIEPQVKQETFDADNLTSYSLVARAVYYACVTMATELQTKEQYHFIRKVYSIWICYNRPIPDIREPIISYSMQPDEEYRYCNGAHETLETPRRKFDNGDLVSVILLSIPDIETAVKKEKDRIGGFTLKTLKELKYLLSDEVDTEKRREFMRKSGIIKKGVNDMSDLLDLEQRITKRMKEDLDRNTEQVTKQVTQQVTKRDIIISFNRLIKLGVTQKLAEESIMEDYHLTLEQLSDILA